MSEGQWRLIGNLYFKPDEQGNPGWHDTYAYGVLGASG